MPDLSFGFTLGDWGELMKKARQASTRATEDARQRKVISDPLDSAIGLYVDDPCAASALAASLPDGELSAICKTSSIEFIAVAGVGGSFPPGAFEANRSPDAPRVAAMFFKAPGAKCPRCRNFTLNSEQEVCGTCQKQIKERASHG